jgi:hypothetical protein
MRQWALNVAKAILPDWFIEWYRRKRAYRRYAHALAYQVYDREVRLELEDVEGRVAASRAGFTDRIVKDILERTELVLQGLDRKVEGVSARQGQALRELRRDLEALRAEVEALRLDLRRSGGSGDGPPLAAAGQAGTAPGVAEVAASAGPVE